MSPDLDKKLCEDFPNLYRDRNASMRVTCMCWGFECGDGWEPLIRRLSEKLEAIIVAIPEPQRAQYCAAQVKEKFGTLRFYMAGTNEEIEAAIDEAEAESAVTCEVCGAPGAERTSKSGWISTLCEEHKR